MLHRLACGARRQDRILPLWSRSLASNASSGKQSDSKLHVVFGAAGGIGSALCALLRQQHAGSTLILADKNGAALQKLASQLGEVETHTVDAAQPQQVQDLLQQVVSKHQRLDGVVSLVGNVMMSRSSTQGAGGSAAAWDPAGALSELRSALDTNLATAFNVLQSSARAMSQLQRGGSIVLTSAAVAETGVPDFAAMSAAKAGVEGLVRTAAAEYVRQGLRINAVAPGLTRTPQTSSMLRGDKPAHTSAATHPVKHVAEPRDVACALAFLLDPGTDFITGQVLAVDGGLSAITQQTQQS